MYYLLTESFKSNEIIITDMILEAVAVDKIYMLGSSLSSLRTESIFLPDAPSQRNVPHYWLLILFDKDTGLGENFIQDKIENTCQHFIPVTAFVFDTGKFNRWLLEGNRFPCSVIQRAIVLKDVTNIPLVIPAPVSADRSTEKTYHAQGINKVNEFLAGADLYKVRKQNKMAAFMLHQAAEHALNAILKIATGLHVNTHNIDKLIRYCSMVNYKIAAIFPETDRKLLSLLQKSYIDTRYKNDFEISYSDLTILFDRLKSFQQILIDCE